MILGESGTECCQRLTQRVQRADRKAAIVEIDHPTTGVDEQAARIVWILVAGEGLDTLRAIAAVLSDQRFATEDYRVDLLYGLSGAETGLEGRAIPLRRAGALVRTLERERIPSDRLSAGLMPSFAGRLRLHFTFLSPPDENEEAATGENLQ